MPGFNSYASRRCLARYRNPSLRHGFTTLLRSITFDFNSWRRASHTRDVSQLRICSGEKRSDRPIEKTIILKLEKNYFPQERQFLLKKEIFAELKNYNKLTGERTIDDIRGSDSFSLSE